MSSEETSKEYDFDKLRILFAFTSYLNNNGHHVSPEYCLAFLNIDPKDFENVILKLNLTVK